MSDFYVVCDLNEVVELYPTLYVGAAHSRAVDSGVCSDFYIVVDYNYADLLDFVIYALGIGSESESVRAYDSACVYDTVLTDTAVVIYLHARVYDRTVANGHARAYICLGVYLYTFANFGTLADIGECAHIAVVGYLYAVGDVARLLNAYRLWLYEFRCKAEKAGQGHIWVVNANESGFYRVFGNEITTHKHNRCACGVNMMGILRIC